MRLIGKFSIGLGVVTLGLATIAAIKSGNEAKWDAKVKMAEINAKNQDKEKNKDNK